MQAKQAAGEVLSAGAGVPAKALCWQTDMLSRASKLSAANFLPSS